MNKKLLLLLALLISLSAPARAEPALTQVNKTNTIRCGYVEYAPALVKDLKTGEWSGFDYDVMKAVADRLQLKVEYTAVTGWGTVVADVAAGKFDMLCNGLWIHPNIGKFALFSRPEFYQPVFVVARVDDKRFTPSTLLNNKEFKMAALDGDGPTFIAKADFPEAESLLLPPMSDFSQVLVTVADKKADFTIVDAYTFGDYNKNNPGKLKIVSPDHPIRIYPTSFLFGKDDFMFRDAINAALDELILDGTVDRIIDKYNEYPNVFYRATIPYKKTYQQEKNK